MSNTMEPYQALKHWWVKWGRKWVKEVKPIGVPDDSNNEYLAFSHLIQDRMSDRPRVGLLNRPAYPHVDFGNPRTDRILRMIGSPNGAAIVKILELRYKESIDGRHK